MKDEVDGLASSTIEQAFHRARAEGRAALVPYVTAGDPSAAVTAAVLEAIAEAGADIIELGIPFSDPVADGLVIQQASERSLAGGFRTPEVFRLVEDFRRHSTTPIVLFGYYNTALSLGESDFAERAAKAGANGALVVDLTFEESHGFRQRLRAHNLDLIPLLAPTTSEPRASRIAAASTGFLYYVSMTGVTGTHLRGFAPVAERVAALRRVSTLPIAVGFGVQSGADVEALAGFVDGVVVGSELVRRIHEAGEAAADAAGAFVAELRAHTGRPD
jgi:tryptophan synthase alpha chain